MKWTMVYALVKMHHRANSSPFVLLKFRFRYHRLVLSYLDGNWTLWRVSPSLAGGMVVGI